MAHRLLAIVTLAASSCLTGLTSAQSGCGSDWECWNMFPYDEVPVLTNDVQGTPGYLDPDVPSPVLIYLHCNGPYGQSGLGEERNWLHLWTASYDGFEHYPGLQNWPVTYFPEDGGKPKETGWIYVIPDGAQDNQWTATCSDVGEWAYWRYWNATPNCCAYNWYVPGSYTEVSSEAPDHATYINNLIKWLRLNYKVDEDRIYVFGYSNGGYMCHRLACENGNYGYYNYPDLDADPSGDPIPPQPIAAVATYAGVTFMNPQNCNGVWPTNVLHTHDIGDEACLYDGGLDTDFAGQCYPNFPRPYPGALTTVSSWIFMNQTTGHGTMLDPIVPFDLAVPYSMAQVLNWPGGRNGSSVQHWRGLFGSHEATFANNYRNRLIEWFLDNPRPDYDIAPAEDFCPTDLNEDGVTDGADLGLLYVSWGEPGPADLDGSGAVDGADVGLLLTGWGSCEL